MSQSSNERALRSRSIKIQPNVSTNAKPTREVLSKTKNSALTKTGTSTRTSLSKTTTPVATSQSRISSIRKTSESTNSTTNNAVSISEVKLLTEKITHLESKIEEIFALYRDLKDENVRIQYAVLELTDLQARFDESEKLRNQLTTENVNLHGEIAVLKSEVSELTAINRINTANDSSLESDQLQLNSNIIIRGAVAKADTPECDLLTVYNSLRSYLGIAEEAEFDPISINVINVNSPNDKNLKPIQVKLQSTETKKRFLQVRRVKKDISPADIGIKGGTSRSILITEELTRSNQDLLYSARSLRGKGNYKFVWSSNGQILARYRQNSKVIRITDFAQVNQLRADLNLDPLLHHGRCRTTKPVESSSSHSSI